MKVTVRDAGDLKAVARQLRDVADGKALRKELTGGIRDVLRPVAAEVKAAYRAGPSSQGKTLRPGGSLRGLLAKATRVEVRTAGKLAGARVRADGRRMPSGMRGLPYAYEGIEPGRQQARWRHPLFGDRDTWVQQPSHPTFYRTAVPHTEAAGRAIDEVLTDVKRKLERAR